MCFSCLAQHGMAYLKKLPQMALDIHLLTVYIIQYKKACLVGRFRLHRDTLKAGTSPFTFRALNPNTSSLCYCQDFFLAATFYSNTNL